MEPCRPAGTRTIWTATAYALLHTCRSSGAKNTGHQRHLSKSFRSTDNGLITHSPYAKSCPGGTFASGADAANVPPGRFHAGSLRSHR